jgi:hypothetical protein
MIRKFKMVSEKKQKFCMSSEFAADLRSVFDADASGEFTSEALNDFEKQLNEWSARCKAELKEHLRPVAKDSPLLCPIGLFGPMGLGRLETSHTHALSWLLNPKAEHGFGGQLIRALLGEIAPNRQRSSFSVREVVSERLCRSTKDADCGRTDIWIEGSWNTKSKPNKWVIVIEAKVDAREGEHQLSLYDQQLESYRARGYEVYGIFLTPTGIKGSNSSWDKLSFQELARSFLATAPKLADKPGYDFFRLYVASVLTDISGIPTGPPAHNPYGLLSFLKGTRLLNP